GVADPEALAHLVGDPALGHVGPRRLTCRAGERVLVELRGEVHHPVHPVAFGFSLFARLLLGGRQRAIVDLDAGAGGQIAQDLHERALLDLDQEAEDITFFAASEAVEELARLMDMKRRCLLAVKRAQTLPAPRTRPLELHIAFDDLDDVGAIPYIVDLLPWH